MSAGKFDLTARYFSDAGRSYRCKSQPETRQLRFGATSNPGAALALTPGLGSLSLTASRRGLGLFPRFVIIRMVTDPPAPRGDYEGVGTRHRVVVFRLSRFTLWAEGQVGTYLGADCVLDRKVPETVR